MGAYHLLSNGLRVIATTTSNSIAVPRIDDKYSPMYVRITSSAPAYVSVSKGQKNAVNTDTLVQPADDVTLCVAGMDRINVVAKTGTANVSILPLCDSMYGAEVDPDAAYILAKYGNDAHLYLAGVAPVSGFTPGNYVESTGVTPASVDQPCGLVLDAAGGGIHASQATSGYRPYERRGIVNTVLGSHSFTNDTYWAAQGPTASKSGNNLLTPSDYDRCVLNTQSPVMGAGAYTIAFELSGSGTCTIWAYNGTDNDFGLTQVTLTATPTIYVTAISPTVSGSAPFVGRRPSDTATSITPRACGVFKGTLTAAQILAYGGIPLTTTAVASSASGPGYLEFDGDDFLTSAPLAQVGDDYYECIAVAVDTDFAGYPFISCVGKGTSPATQLGDVYVNADGTLSTRSIDNSAAATYATYVGYTATRSVPFVVEVEKVSGQVRLGVNGAFGAWAATPTSNLTVTEARLGAGSAIRAFDRQFIKGQVSDADKALCRKFAAQCAGITL